jgi:methionyl-tRNA synthetase
MVCPLKESDCTGRAGCLFVRNAKIAAKEAQEAFKAENEEELAAARKRVEDAEESADLCRKSMENTEYYSSWEDFWRSAGTQLDLIKVGVGALVGIAVTVGWMKSQ